MRLLNVETRKLQEFVVSVPKYAILSHTWGDDEVTFQDLEHPNHTKKRGYTKIDGLCCLAAKNGFEWVWVDTCCIDKTSSAELSEAINSMYRWYKDASTCYAYLEDIQPDKCPIYAEDENPRKNMNGDDDDWSSNNCDYPEAFFSHFRNSRWFTRGWTLQELLAPESLYFFNAAWKRFGTRSSLAHRIESVTSIPVRFLRKHPYPDFRSARVAVRMSWAARRQTTRVEDGAYCLLGIFDVNMPLLYGEGERAFERLQLEILKGSPDESMLAWRLPCELGSLICLNYLEDRVPKNLDRSRLLASSPQEFAWWFGTDIKAFYETENSIIEMTSRGLRITLPIVEGRIYSYGVLNHMTDNTFDKILAIRLENTNAADEYQNAGLVTLSWQIVKKCQKKDIHIVKRARVYIGRNIGWDIDYLHKWTRLQPPHSIFERLVDVIPKHSYNKEYSCVTPWWWKDLKTGKIGGMGRIFLHYKQNSVDDKQDHDGNGEEFVVILSPTSAFGAFFSFGVTPPPFVCHTLPMLKGEKLEHFLSRDEYCHIYATPPGEDYHDLSKLRNRFSLESGVPRARIQREKKIDCDHWVVSVHRTRSLAEYAGSIAKPITNLRPLSGPRWFREFRREFRHDPLFYVNDLLLGLVPVVTWGLNSKRRRISGSWKEATTCGVLSLLLFLLRYKAHLAILSQGRPWPRLISPRLALAGFYHQVIYVPFALWFPLAMYTLFPRSRKEVKVNPLVSVLSSLAIVILARRVQKFL
ncbi:HET domain-containing protein [Colletotrichum scovillei]|uniref:HET-domain-containing protein n=1 Tax=Colletotrichum scovillei TaxID=1209932 RepID=A0A9P7UCX8_9PEZI|nr:HET domain-containing protein [Colletotrichum scovillei]KAF4783364.1 HET domain-containing protein [Colletotrichum scovillei]KAG7051018.1 HET-domain-containing protein [Colletotrichum scovillei]KAG7070056.1 HET-domain-containing protein [Colletotrichum scovillei]KAG7078306.1 HET-domain-containing protein [Colletotrichum scovillei]